MFPIRKILLPVDFSGRSSQAVRFAVPLADRFQAEIILLHVLPPYHEFGGVELAGAILTGLVAERQEEARRRIAVFLRDELGARPVRRLSLDGDPAREIVACARREEAGLILLPTHGYGPFRRMLLGSVTAKVLHDADCPVWTTAHAETSDAAAMPLQRVLCGVEHAAAGAPALAWAARLAAAFGAELTLVHPMAELDPRTEGYYFSPEWRKFLVDNAEKEIAALQRTAGTNAHVLLTTGPAAEMICEEARQTAAGLLVIPRGGLTGHAYSIIRQSPCPVVSV